MIHIACSADGRFVQDCGVMLHSLLTANAGEAFEIHFLHDERLPADDLVGLEEIALQFGAVWSPLVVTPDAAKAFPLTERFGLNAWYRVLLPQVLPGLAKVLYLDADLLILGRLRSLWDTDLRGNALAAVTQPIPDDMLPRIRDTLGLQSRDDYFNTGVMLLDLNELRRRESMRQVLAFIQERRAPMPWADQDPMNAVLHGARLTLPVRWNVMTPMFDSPSGLPPFTEPELRAAIALPAIVHFIGEYKPLHYRCRHPYRRQYFEHLAHTRWNDRRIYGRNLRHMLLRPLPWVWQHRMENLELRLRGWVRRGLARLVGNAST